MFFVTGPGDLCAMKACVHASAHLAFIMLSFWALVTYLAVNLWLRGYGYQSKDTIQSKIGRSVFRNTYSLYPSIPKANMPQYVTVSIQSLCRNRIKYIIH